MSCAPLPPETALTLAVCCAGMWGCDTVNAEGLVLEMQ